MCPALWFVKMLLLIYLLLERANAVMFTLKNTPMGFFYVNCVKRKFLLFVAENVKIEK